MKTNFRCESALVLVSALLLGSACESTSAPQASAGGASKNDVAARVGDREITLSDVDARALKTNMKTYQELYNLRRAALEDLVAEALLEQEAVEQGTTVEDLLAREVEPKVAAVTEKDVEAFFEQNRSRLGGQTLEQIGDQIREFLVSRNEAMARDGYIAELRGKGEVSLSLQPPRISIEVAANERTKGPPDAPVTIVEYSDFQ